MQNSIMTDSFRKSVKEFFCPFREQYEAISYVLIRATGKYPVALIAVFGSILTGVGRNSDIDFLVLVKDEYKSAGYNLHELKWILEDLVEEGKVNKIPIDLTVTSVSSFLDLTTNTWFKRGFSDNNWVIWEDGESFDSTIFVTV